MKKVLRYFTFMVVLAFGAKKSVGQCSASDILIRNIVAVGAQTPGTCNAVFDLSFTMEANNGNKFIFFHAWRPDLYPDYFDCVDGEPSGNGAIAAPEASDLAAAFINIGIDNSGAVPVLLTSYPPSAGVTLNTAASVTRTVLPDGSYSFTINDLAAVLPGDCNGPIVITADFWSSQSANAQNAQCVNCSVDYALNFVQSAGIAQCLNLAYTITLTNRTTTALSGDYLIYADVNNDGVLNSTVDALIRDTTSFSIAAGVGMTTLITGSIPGANINQNLFVLVVLSSPAEGSSLFTVPSTQCTVLPVTFLSFAATRSNAQTVNLRWETGTEINNRGFYVERNAGRNTWETVVFVPTQAPNGNSTSTLTYVFDDPNPFRGTSQYRIRQEDINGSSRYSEIRLVRGDMDNSSMIVYPNPATSGRINVLFDDERVYRDLVLFDMNGRVVRKWDGLTQNSVQIETLNAGVYTLRMVNRETGTTLTEKIIVY